MSMKRSITLVLLLGPLCNASFAVILFSVAPAEEFWARSWACTRPESRQLHSAYTNLIQKRIWPLKFSDMPKIFGPKLETATNWWGSGANGRSEGSGPALARRPVDLVLPIVAPAQMMVSGL